MHKSAATRFSRPFNVLIYFLEKLSIKTSNLLFVAKLRVNYLSVYNTGPLGEG